KVCEQGHAEFVEDLSSELPLQAIAEMVGIPIEDRSKIFDWTNRMIGGNDPDFAVDADEATGAAAELFAYSRGLQMERRDQPADDIITTLLSADVDGEKLSEDEFDMFFLLLSVAGNETTRNSITRGMMGFFDFPDQWEKYKSDPARYEETMVDEVVRWATPVLHFRRQCTQDYELNGVQMKAGDKVVLWHIAANRSA
ncbi:MAG: cytochrome P450, partial [Actinobacteria bacterium]|nr:cytochrome P450 [Actinomycetota bacterium]